MDYERKYKDALGWMQSLYDGLHGATKEDAEHYFPELAESEDERIRKDLIGFFKDEAFLCHKIEDIIAWLEKQGGNPAPININKMVMEYSQTKDGDFGLPVNCQIRAYRQGINDTISILNLEKQGEKKPADMVEKKFHEGDWIVSNKKLYVYQIEEINDFVAKVNENGESFVVDVKCLNDAHLWTIQDAKDGDVLVNGSNIFIFHFLNDTRLMGYCHVNIDNGRFYDDIGKNECFCLIDAVVNPATKEQCDLLFAKMKEAGYEWDADVKELKKIHIIDEGKAEMDYCFTKMMNGEKVTPAWSEEDERNLEGIIDEIEANKNQAPDYDLATYDRFLSWLKSLKDRITWKPSDEQMKALHLRMEHQTVCNDAGGNKMWSKAWRLVNEAINAIKDDKETFKW